MWHLEFAPEARSFFIDNRKLVDDLLESIQSLKETEGLPDIGAIEVEPEYYFWLTNDHIVSYRRIESRQVCRIISIRPDTY